MDKLSPDSVAGFTRIHFCSHFRTAKPEPGDNLTGVSAKSCQEPVAHLFRPSGNGYPAVAFNDALIVGPRPQMQFWTRIGFAAIVATALFGSSAYYFIRGDFNPLVVASLAIALIYLLVARTLGITMKQSDKSGLLLGGGMSRSRAIGYVFIFGAIFVAYFISKYADMNDVGAVVFVAGAGLVLIGLGLYFLLKEVLRP